jgi:hypothetical protein
MKILKKDGSLSTYGYSCGYVNRVENKITGQYKELYKEHGIFHVKWNIGNGIECESSDSLTDALKKFKSLITF